ncbi:MFS transporter [Amycolatopsis sp. 195334CR]|uniref:MFS transporter n=1 Tax=Amycolatopsis sp. 195334CR TaxID=2814588 RepID=UPI0027DD85A6|nr:MFS transporter [Amycolatopsis sp. 195334CR]
MTDTDLTAARATPAKFRYPREIWVLVGASFLIAIGYGLIAPALPSYATSFNVGVTAASVVVSAFAAMRLVFAPASGRLVTRFGERPVYLWGLLIVAVFTLACAAATEYWHLLLFRSLSGVGSTMFTVSAIGLLIRISPPDLRGRVSGLWGTSFLLGSIAGPVVGSGLVAVSLRAPFLIYGLALLLVVVLVWLNLRRSELAGRAEDDTTAPQMKFTEALRHPAYRASLMSNFANGWVVFGVRGSLIPLFIVAVLARGEEFTGFALAVFAAGNVLVMMISGRFADTRGRKPMALAGLVMLAVGSGVLGLTDNVWLFLGASMLAGIGAGTVNPAHNAAVADVLGVKARGGGVLAGFQMAADIGAVTGPLVAAVIAEQWSYGAAFAITGAVAGLSVLFWIVAPETLPKPEPDEHKAQDAVREDCCKDS